MRALLPYLQSQNGPVTSVYMLETGMSPAVPGVEYLRIPYVDLPRKKLWSLLRGAWSVFKKLKNPSQFIILTNSMRDVLLGLLFSVLSKHGDKTTIWVMDDFVGKIRTPASLRNWILERLFAWLYRRSDQRIVASAAMAKSYKNRYGVTADHILGRTLVEVHAPNDQAFQSRTKIKIVYVGSFLDYYIEPILVIKSVIDRLPVAIEVDLYGMHPPGADWLLPGIISYKGVLRDEHLLETLNQYDFGLVPYSFNIETIQMMALSFPSKLIDYVGASLPLLIFAPENLSFLDEVRKYSVGQIETKIDKNSVVHAFKILGSLSRSDYLARQVAAQAWAKNEFVLTPEKIDEIFY